MAAELEADAPFTVTIAAQDGTVTVCLHGGLDASTVPVLRERLGPVLGERPGALVFDLAELRFLDCAGARILAGAGQALPAGQRPVLRAPGPIVRRLLRLTGLDRQFTIEPTRRPARGPARGGPVSDVAELIAAEHERIVRLFAGLEDTARYAAPGRPGAGPDWILAAMWAQIATFLELHADAAQEICYQVVFAGRTGRADERETAVADLDDLREAVAEARLYPAGSPAWWQAVDAARNAASAHIALLDRALSVFGEQLDPQRRHQLSRQWEAFMAARRHDAAGRAGRPRQRQAPLRNAGSGPGRLVRLARPGPRP